MPDETLNLWESLEKTDPRFAKDFNRGGFKGTAINPCYLAKKLTHCFGPCGLGWRFVLGEERYVEGHILKSGDKMIIHVVRGHLDWRVPGESTWFSTGEQFGQTTFVGENKNGTFTDEEAPKKSMTDVLSKCAVLLGASADVHLGQWDANKYVNTRASSATRGSVSQKPKDTPDSKASADAPEHSTKWHAHQWREWLLENGNTSAELLAAFKPLAKGVAAAGDTGSRRWAEICKVFADVFRDVAKPGKDKTAFVKAMKAERVKIDAATE